LWACGVGDWGSMVHLGDGWGGVSVRGVRWGGIGEWGSVHLGHWSSIGDWGGNLGHGDGWCLSVYNSVESIDWVSGVGDSSDGTIGLHERVLSLDNISVTGFLVVLGITGQTILNGVGVVVLWVSIIWLWGDSLHDCCWGSVGDWGSVNFSNWSSVVSDRRGSSVMGNWGSCVVGDWGCGVGRGQRRAWSSGGETQEGEENDCLDHDDEVWKIEERNHKTGACSQEN